MNPTKLLAEISSTLERHWPTLIVHIVLFAWLIVRVIHPDAIPDGNSIWSWLLGRIDTALTAVGAKLEPWYVLAALGVAYLAGFQWLREFVVNRPVVRIFFDWRFRPGVLGRACQVLRLPPEIWTVENRLRRLVDLYAREAEEKGSSTPYKWLFERRARQNRYYGALVIALIAAIAWWIEGGTYARTPGRVAELAGLLFLICLAVRRTIARDGASAGESLGHWALSEHERREPPAKPDPLGWMRYNLACTQAEFERARRRHPSEIIERLVGRATRLVDWAFRLTGRSETLDKLVWQRVLKDFPRAPGWHPDQAWQLIASQVLTIGDEEVEPPGALRADAFVSRFAPLLECPGTGLCILVPRSLGLAPVVDGNSYCFAERRHGGQVLTLKLDAETGLSGARIVPHSREQAYLVELGNFPIERLAQGDLPETPGHGLWRVASARLDDDEWRLVEAGADVSIDGVSLFREAELKLGSSYLLGARTRSGTSTVVAFQCFGAGDDRRLLIAWRILAVGETEKPPEVQPWWEASVWRDLLRLDRFRR